MKQKLMLALALCLIGAASANAQNSSVISGEVKDNAGKPIKAATVLLQRAKDSSLAKTEVTDANGVYTIRAVKPGNYFIRTTVSGLQASSSAVFTLKEGECLGACGDAPVVLRNNKQMLCAMSNEKIDKLIEELK